MGWTVDVVDVVHNEAENRIRGRISKPPGWISLCNTETGLRWAVWQDRLSLRAPTMEAEEAEDEEDDWDLPFALRSPTEMTDHFNVFQLPSYNIMGPVDSNG